MPITESFKKALHDPPRSFKVLQILIAGVCFFIPIAFNGCDNDLYYPKRITLMSEQEIERVLDTPAMNAMRQYMEQQVESMEYKPFFDSTMEIHGLSTIPRDNLGYRLSLSDYAYGSKSYLFGMFYCMAAMLYLYNGVVYMKRKDQLNIQRRGDWINVFIGLSLIGVILNPESPNGFLHYLFTVLFFLGNIIEMLLPKQHESNRFKRIRVFMAGLTVMSLVGSFLEYYTLLWGKWMSLTIISSFLIMMSLSRIRKSSTQ